ncbi:MAG: potassium transporter TrkG, partial [bacterium]
MIKAYSIRRIEHILHHISILVALEGFMFFIPLIVGLIYNETSIIHLLTRAFIIPGSLMIIIGLIVNRFTRPGDMQLKDAMFICTLTWIVFSILGAIPFIVLADMSFIDSFFETMSGFTTTGITLIQGLDKLPYSILLWRALIQWIGGLGILSVFILIGFKGAAAVDKLFFSETHKIAAEKPHPGIFNTVKTLWKLYIGFTLAEMLILFLLGLGPFDALTHSLTTVATGGFSIHDSSIAHFRIAGYSNFNLIEITVMLFMMIGGINFLVHYNVLTGNIKSLWKNFEMKYFWIFLLGGISIIALTSIINTGIDYHFDGL